MAYLMIMVETVGGGSIRWANLPAPPGRTMKAVQHMWHNLKDDLKDDIQTIKAAQPAKDGEDGEATTKSKPRTPRKKKGENGVEPATPKTKSPRKRKSSEASNEGESPAKRSTKEEPAGEDDNGSQFIRTEINGDEVVGAEI